MDFKNSFRYKNKHPWSQSFHGCLLSYNLGKGVLLVSDTRRLCAE